MTIGTTDSHDAFSEESGKVEESMAATSEIRVPSLNGFWIIAVTLSSWFSTFDGLAADDVVSFAKQIQPVLAKKCVSCHGPEKQKAGLRLDRKSAVLKGGDDLGPAIVPGKSRESPLFRVVAGLEAGLEMPAEGEKLTAAEIDLLKRWIDSGAEWPDDGSEKEDVTKSHWAFNRLSRPVLPSIKNHQSIIVNLGNPIDLFIVARLERDGLKLSAEADRATLIRRLKFDLLGLPPSPDEVEEFVADSHEAAYERLVDRYLASPHLGERWARHWLDVVRFAESHGFEMNQPRPNAWPYRDYVIRSFNEDQPYDQFVFEQLAGDTVGVDEATGFLVGGPWDQVKSPDLGLTLQQRADELHDMVSTTGSVFLGLTVGCARCHNHKFDPISQLDYYGMKACFAGVQHGDRPLRTADSDQRQRQAAAIREQLAVIEAEITRLDPQSKRNGALFVERFTATKARFVRMTIHATNSSEPCIDELEVFTAGAKPENVALASRGTKAKASSSLPGFAIHKLEHVNDGRYGNSFSWISNEPGRGWVELELPQDFEIDRIVWSRDRDPAQFKDRTATKYVFEISTDKETWQAVSSFPDSKLSSLSPENKARVEQLIAQRTALQKTAAELGTAPMVYSGKLMPPEETFRLHRGDPLQKREPVAPAGLASFSETWRLDTNAAEATRRVQLAKWINHPANPLTARVMANRLWHYHFGAGLVETPSDFGLNGGRPSHPELLDWLASEMSDFKSDRSNLKSQISNPESESSNRKSALNSLKRLHRLIVTSATYRQASAPREEGLAVDAGSRLLWRFPPKRLEAEVLRDAILATSGQLDRRMNGTGFDLFEANANYVRVFNSKQQFSPETDFRRMVYAHKHRMQLDDTFGTFDCPDGGQVAPKRNSSNTPLQALNLLNSHFLVQQADLFAARILATSANEPTSQAFAAMQLAFGRTPNSDEVEIAAAFLRQHGLPALCRALLNANEFLFVQ
jgi:mono/diheme cytochrome c family protein